MPSSYLYLDLPEHVMRNVSRFCLRACTIAVGSSIWRGRNGHCDKCSCAAVQNEVHVLFQCHDLLVCVPRKKYSFLSSSFLPVPSCGVPCFLHALPSQTAFDFLSQRHNKLCHFMLDNMDYYLADKDQQRANQPNDQAGD